MFGPDSLLPHLPSDRLIQAVGNVEQRDALRWLRDEALAEAHRCLGNEDAIEAAEHPMAAAANGLVMLRAYQERRHPPFRAWIDEFFRRHPLVAIGAAARAAIRRRTGGRASGSPELWHALGNTLERTLRDGGAAGLIVSAAIDARTDALMRPVAISLGQAGLRPVWLKIAAGAPEVRATSAGSWTEIEAPPRALAPPRSDEAEQPFAALRRAARDDDPFARAMATRLDGVIPEWDAGRKLARIAARAGGLRFVLVAPDKSPLCRGVVAVARTAGASTFALFPSIEIGAPSLFLYAAAHVLVPNVHMVDRLVEAGVDRARLAAVGSTEVDLTLESIAACRDTAESTDVFRLLFLTKWPDCAVRNGEVLRETLASCEASGRPYQVRIKTHPKDRRRYTKFLGSRVDMAGPGYETHLAWCHGAVSGMSNSVFHLIAAGRPVVLANLNDRIDLGAGYLFARGDVPSAMRYAPTGAAVRTAVGAMLAEGRVRYDLSPSLINDFFVSLDGGTADRIAARVFAAVESERGVVRHA